MMVTIKEVFQRLSNGRSMFERDPNLGPQEVRDKRYDGLVRQRTKQLMDEHAKVLEKEILEHQRAQAARQFTGDGKSFLSQDKKRIVKKDTEFYGKSNLLR